MEIKEKMISLVNKNGLARVIKTYTNEEYRRIDMTEHIEEWAKNKEHIFKLFGNKLKIEKEVDTQLPVTLIEAKLEAFLKNDFKESKYNLIKAFLMNLGCDEIADNLLQDNFKMFDVTFKRGTKISKCFKSLIKKEWLEEANIKYSMFLQSLKAKGTAVLSIDPMDYLTMSANGSGWRSCHAPDGEYRVGTVAYLMDGPSVISYVKSSEDCVLCDGTIHTNKIWRQIVLINDENTYALQLRQYPNSSHANAETVGKMLVQAIEGYTGVSYNRHTMDLKDDIITNLQESNSMTNILFYNDLDHDAFDTGYGILPSEFSPKEFEEIVHKPSPHSLICVGPANIPCLCGCGASLADAEYYFYENSCDYDDYSDENYYD